jgi:hypothetical protein
MLGAALSVFCSSPVPRRDEHAPPTVADTPAFGAGWGAPEGEYRWTIGPRAELLLSTSARPPSILRLQAHAYPHSTRGAGQRVILAVGSELVGTLAFRGADLATRAVPLPQGLPPGARVTLDLPDVSADSGGPDPRPLGIAVHWLRLDPFPHLGGDAVDLGRPAGEPFLGDGWGAPEAAGRWTVGLSAEIFFAADSAVAGGLVLAAEPFLHRRLPRQHVRFELNGEPVGAVTFAEAGLRSIPLAIPPGVLRPANVLRLLLPDARSPASVGLNRDSRVLALRVGTLQLQRR